MNRVLPGNHVFLAGAAPSDELIARLARYSPTDLVDAQYGANTMDGRIHTIIPPSRRLAGPALTVSLTPGNGKVLRAAIAVARPGDVLVVNSYSNQERAVFGLNVARTMLHTGIRGLIVDGVFRDPGSIASEETIPMFALGVTARSGSDEHGYGEVNAPVACGGVVVAPNDIVVADLDGITVVPFADAEFVAGALDAAPADGMGVKGVINGALRSQEPGPHRIGFHSLEMTWLDYQGS